MPTRQTIAAGLILAVGAPLQAAEIFATSVQHFAQATQADGGPVAAARSNPNLALGEPVSGIQPDIDFVTLGLGGSIVLSFDQPFATSLRIFETTWGERSAWPESANVAVGVGPSVDAATWYEVTSFLNTEPRALGEPISLAPVHLSSGQSQFDFVRIVDTTAALEAGISYEGIDINSVGAETVPEPATIALAGLALLFIRRR
jgi:hypothetical protein